MMANQMAARSDEQPGEYEALVSPFSAAMLTSESSPSAVAEYEDYAGVADGVALRRSDGRRRRRRARSAVARSGDRRARRRRLRRGGAGPGGRGRRAAPGVDGDVVVGGRSAAAGRQRGRSVDRRRRHRGRSAARAARAAVRRAPPTKPSTRPSSKPRAPLHRRGRRAVAGHRAVPRQAGEEGEGPGQGRGQPRQEGA